MREHFIVVVSQHLALDATRLRTFPSPHPVSTPGHLTTSEINSTTTSQILAQFFGGYSARRQLPTGIRLIPTLSVLMELQDWRSQMLDGRLLHNRCSDFKSVFWRLLGIMSATCRYKVRSYRMKAQNVLDLYDRSLGTLAEFCLIADFSTTTGCIRIPFPGGCWARR